MAKTDVSRRTFVKTAGLTGVGLGLQGVSPAILQGRPSFKIVVGMMGVNSRGRALAKSFAALEDVEVGYVCEVDQEALARAQKEVAAIQGIAPAGMEDIREMVLQSDMDALVIAAPDHWHTPAALMALSAGKHVYLEKPGSHNAAEAMRLLAVQQETDLLIQLGTQRRSGLLFQEAIARIHDGELGTAYFAKAWYANRRGSIGYGKRVVPPAGLNYDLWQGPAPRRPFRDNLVHYNWHWFRHWGTGEACNNGTHHVDLCRWALGVDYPLQVTSAGGRFHFQDDWEFFDTQVMSFEFPGGKSITWEGRSCNPLPTNSRGFGVSIHGTEGSMVLDSQGYVLYDLENSIMEERLAGSGDDGLNPVGAGDLTDRHIANFCDAIRGKQVLTQPFSEGHKSAHLCHLGNIAQFSRQTLRCNPDTGAILGESSAKQLWGRSYEPGWEIGD